MIALVQNLHLLLLKNMKEIRQERRASSDRIDRQRNEQRIRDIVSGAIQPKDIDEEREFAGVKAAMTGWDE